MPTPPKNTFDTPTFPEPEKIAGRNYWTKGKIRRWRAENAGLPAPPPQANDDALLTARQVREMFGNVSDMWLWRRRQQKNGKLADANATA